MSPNVLVCSIITSRGIIRYPPFNIYFKCISLFVQFIKVKDQPANLLSIFVKYCHFWSSSPEIFSYFCLNLNYSFAILLDNMTHLMFFIKILYVEFKMWLILIVKEVVMTFFKYSRTHLKCILHVCVYYSHYHAYFSFDISKYIE